MHANLGYLFAGFAATWVALFAYIVYIQHRLTETRQRLRWIEEEVTAPSSSDQRSPNTTA
jgi:CcmD family protein